jgi:DNA-binding winged helix-turn-helix (wHTH) protein
MMVSFDGEDSKMATNGRPAALSIAFGPFRVFPMQRLITKSDQHIPIGSRAFDILVALIERPGELVSKDELIARVWPSTHVDQANLAVQIGALRRVLDDGQRGSRYIVNIPGRGYRFVAPVSIESGAPSQTSVPLDGEHLPAVSEVAVSIPAPAARDGNEGPPQRRQQRRVLTILRSAGAGEAQAALALVEKLLASYGDRLWVVGIAPIEEC